MDNAHQVVTFSRFPGDITPSVNAWLMLQFDGLAVDCLRNERLFRFLLLRFGFARAACDRRFDMPEDSEVINNASLVRKLSRLRRRCRI